MRERLEWCWLSRRWRSGGWSKNYKPGIALRFHLFLYSAGKQISVMVLIKVFGFFFLLLSLPFSHKWKREEKKILPFYLWYEIIFPNPWLCARLNPAAKFPVKAKHPVACLYYLSEDTQVQRGWEGRITWSNANRDFLFYANVLIVVWERGICGDVWIQPVCRNKIWCHSTCICNSA